MKTLHYQPYIDELNRMIEAEKFAKRFPLFKDFILKNKINDTGSTSYLGEKFLDTDLGSPVFFYSCFGKEIKNYKNKTIDVPLIVFFIDEWYIFIKNFEKNIPKSKFGDTFYDEIMKDLYESIIDLVFLYDPSSKKYFVTEENLEEFCNILNIWYKNAIVKNKQYIIEQKRKKLQKELDNLQG